ncbi:putative bifunctional diguanylate cyclase/phosphodiesterase [Trichlorobacter ammonificans]|uniref:Diguanylate cyclase n=1 Tax=Trichlorobacter ammonificans TaxID=2916410 RepID=A0ABM9DAT4_9BACT|nr:EAL domain-containing protein [Trichlorobacter ammonificans]CAH2031875.1 putative Diguanylate cyclase [Trichlorobacter ammonificans]
MNRFHFSLRARITLAVTGLVLLLMLGTALLTVEQVFREYSRILKDTPVAAESVTPEHFTVILQTARHRFLAATAIGTALVALLVTLLVRLLTRPLTVLTRHMQQLPQKSGDDRYLHLTERDDIGQLAAAFNTMIEELERHCRAVQENEQRYRIVTESAADFTYWQRPDGSFEFASPACKDVTGYSREELASRPELLLEMIHPADRGITAPLHITADSDACCISDEIEYRIITRDGTVRWVRHAFQPIYDEQGNCLGRRGSSTDITERKQLAEQVSHLVLHDLLTGLPNRSLFTDRLSLALTTQQSRSNASTITAVLFFGIDRFKLINDTLGHDTGDRILIMTAERLRKMLHTGDTLCRFGGDVFAMILPERESRHEAITMSYRILACLTEPFRLSGQQVTLTGSIGIAVSPEDGTDSDTLLKGAETAMYEAKRSGKNCFRFYAREMNFQAVQLLKLDNSMPISLDRGDFYLHYQPQLDLKSGTVIGVEALLRWRHPELGMIPPDRFIPLAEENGFITRLGAWVLKTACMQAASWQRHGLPPLRVAVNISSRQFSEPDFVDLVSTTLTGCGLNADLLELELTESLLVSNEQQVARKLQGLKAMGIHLAIDDFGTGYSSLSYLKHFPLDRLKIDKSFVNDILSDPDDAAITEAIIGMAHALKLKVIAEGVETREQLLFLEDRGCDEMQGYYLSRPLSEHDLIGFMKSRETDVP